MREGERESGSDVYQVDFSVREKEGLASEDVWGGSATRGILTAGTADSWLAHDDDDVDDGDGDVWLLERVTVVVLLLML